MMGTRAAAFAGKISNLRESILRIQNGTMPQPTCLDLATMMKYFSQVLHDFRDFKDIEHVPLYASEKRDRMQLIKTLPNFDYSGLYNVLSQLVDILPLIPPSSNGLEQLGSNLLMLFKCLVPFLDQANMETMPYLVATLFMSLPPPLHKDVLDTLCFNLLPFTIDQQRNSQSVMLNTKRKQQSGEGSTKSAVRKTGGSSKKRPVSCIVRIEDPNESNEKSSEEKKLGFSDSLEDQGIGSDTEAGGNANSTDDCDEEDEGDYALLSVTSILMIAFHYITEPMHHSQLVECLMKLKGDVFEDLLYVIAYGTTRARCPAVEMLFRYWPDICPSQQDRKNNSQANKLKHVGWQPTKCQNKKCSFTSLGDDEAVKMCLDFKISITLSGMPPPMLVCLDCVGSIYPMATGSMSCIDAEQTSIKAADNFASGVAAPGTNAGINHAIDAYGSKFIDLLLPMERVAKLCENKKCRSQGDKTAIGTCFDIECANYNCKKPIRYCKNCFISIHEPCAANNYDVTLQSHIRHSSINLNIMDDEDRVNNFIEAIISLLKEAAPADKPSKDSERYLRSLMGPMSQFNTDNKDMNIATEEKQLISQYGIWLMTGLCKTVDKISDELLGRLLGMLFQWFHFTACLPDDQAGSALEKLKGECIKGWIMDVKNQRLDVFISCLLPHPVDCSKIGGHWEVWPDTAHQIKEGFKRLLCLVPYDIITDDVWDEIMPHWMECFRHEVPENELSELKILLSKVFDPELSPLGFETKQMYNFISSRFEDCTNTNQEQTLYWLQIITMLEIPIPIDFLFRMLKSGVKSLAQIRANELIKLNKMAAASAKNTLSNSESTSSAASSSSSSTATGGSVAGSERSGSRSSGNDNESHKGIASKTGDSSPMTGSQGRPLSQQERQAQARAAFSARVLQQASLLDAPTAAQKSASSTAVGSSSGQQQPTTTLPGSQSKDNLNPILSKPLKSATTSSMSGVVQQAAATGASCAKKTATIAVGETKSERPKLELQVSAAQDEHLIDSNLICYILMMDILLKQLDLQEINAHRGLDGREAQQAIELLNDIISTPWVGRHTCSDSLPQSIVSPSQVQPSSGGGLLNQHLSTSSTTNAKVTGESSSSQKASGSEKEETGTPANVHLFRHCVEGHELEDSNETCVFCEIISTFHQLSMFLIEFFAPVIEVSICEVSQDAANGEFDGKPDYSRIGLDHLGPSPKIVEGDKFNFHSHHLSNQLTTEQPDPTSPFSPSYTGPSLKPDVLKNLPMELQLSYNLLVQFHQYQTPDIVSQLLQMIKLISLHSQVLSKAAKNNPQFISWCQHNMLVSKLWSLCQLESSEIARTCVPLLLHCITLPWGVRLFRDLVERDFNSDNWLSRFRAVERVVTIAYFCEPSTIKNSTLLQSTMASAFCYVVRCLDDIEAIVAQRALVSLEMMKTSSLKLLLWCLEVQFDYLIVDRPMILRSVFQLYNHLRDRRFLTWEFFLNRFDTIFLEAQIYLQQTGEIPSFTMQDLKNTNTKSEIYQKKIMRAKEALQETHHSRSLSSRFQEKQFSSRQSSFPAAKTAKNPTNEEDEDENGDDCMLNLSKQYKQSVKLQHQMQQQGPSHKLDKAAGGIERRRAQSPTKRVMQHGRSTSSRYQSVAFLTSQSMVKRTNSKFLTNLAMQSVPPLMLPDKLHQHLPNSFVDDGSKLNEIAQENHVFGVVHRICDEDRDTMHSLIFLLMQFFSKPDPSHPQSVKTLNRSHQIVLRHLNILMGYSVARKNFLIAATNLRLLPVFNAFLTSLPKVLDFNYSLGSILLDTCLPVLIYCPAPDDVQYDSLRIPSYSLWLLNPLMRQSWLMSVMAFLYKYQFGHPHLKEHVYMLMWIVINTLEMHLNCSTLDSVALDRCLINVRDSTASAGAGDESLPASGHATVKVHASSSVAANSSHHQELQATSSSGSGQALESPIKGDHKSEPSTELQSPATGSKLAPSNSSGSLKQSGSSSQQASTSNSSNQTISMAAASTPPTATKSLIKADTSDSLNVKAKLFQRKADESGASSDFGRTGSSKVTSSSGKLNNSAAEQTTDPTPKSLAATTSSNKASGERLLPIGISHSLGGHRTRSNFDLPATERLLPIGVYRVEPQQQPQAQDSRLSVGSARSEHPTAELTQEMAGKSATATNQLPVGSGYQSGDQGAGARYDQQSSGTGAESSQVQEAATLKNNKRRFGAPSAGSTSKQQALLGLSGKELQADSSAKSSTFSVGGGRKNKSKDKGGPKEYVPPKQVNTVQPSFSSPSLLNEQLAQINRHSIVQEFSDKDLSMCLVILETFIHHEPSMAASMLPNILRLVARYSSASLDSLQSGSNVHLVGGSMFVARQFIRVALHDLMENNIFHQIFTSHFTGYEFYKSMATALADFTDLNQLAPLSKLFEDLNKQKNLPQATSLMTILENVATYFECIIGESATHSQATWTNFITNWENFLRKLILALPRYSGSSTSSSSATSGQMGIGRSDNVPTSPVAGQTLASAPGAGSSGQVATAGSTGAANQVFLSSRANASSSNADNSANLASANAIPSSCSMIMAPIMRIILSTSKISHLASCKTIVDPYSKIISYTVLNSQFKYEHLLEINHNCCRLYAREREKYLIQRTIAYELVQVLKFRFFILEENLLILLLFMLQDVGGTLAPRVVKDSLKIDQTVLSQAESFITNVSECLRQYIGDLLEFITDVHAISRINDNLIGSQPSSINRDSFGGHVKAAISQYLALEMSINNGADNRTVLRYLPWLYTSPSLQQGPREFIDCVSHIRQLSWIILGSLQHSTLMRGHTNSNQHSTSNLGQSIGQHSSSSSINCQPIPIEKNGNVAEHVQVILAGFAEQSKESVLHMSGLFHAFLLCQLWTMYCENICSQHPANSEQYQFSQSTLDDFWAKITPGVLRLVGHSRVMSEMVSTHFLQLIESLIESNSSILIRYLPMWNSVFYSYKRRNKSSNLAIRLQKCIEWQPPALNEQDMEQNNKRLINWLEKVQYKMSHIEIQSSQAAPFYLT